MPLDTNGIWQYEEGEGVPTASDLLNRLAASTSQRVGDLDAAVNAKQDDLGDTGWMLLELTSDFTAYSTSEDLPRYRRVGPWVECYARLSPATQAVADAITAGSEGVVIAQLPPEAAPLFRRTAVMQGSGHARWALTVQTDGLLRCGRYAGGTTATGTWLPFNYMFFAG